MWALATVLVLASAATAKADFAVDKFATTGDAFAGWNTVPAAPPGATDQQSILLFVNGSSAQDLGDSAVAKFKGFTAALPASPPSFDFRANRTGPSGGSVRLRVQFSDAGYADLRPASLVAGQWIHMDGTADWDNYGGSCGFRFQQPYSAIAPCHPGATVTGVEVTNDSGWLHPGGLDVLIDNVSFGGETVMQPPPPAVGERVSVTALSGTVVVKVPNGAAPPTEARLRGSASLLVGSSVDARFGKVKLNGVTGSAKTLTANARGGEFKVSQSSKSSDRGLITFTLNGSLAGCGASASTTARASAGAKKRRLWARGKGKFRTKGRHGAASVRGTHWFVEDRCNGTYFKTLSGSVSVFDADLKKSLLVKRGKGYFARNR